jgi:opacity protein-like surface antigen
MGIPRAPLFTASLLLATGVAVAPVLAATHSAAPDATALPNPAAIPDDTVLEAAGARIGLITINSAEIFDLSDPRENRWLYRAANRWHINTRAGVVRAQLLFRSGEPYLHRLLEESERKLRQLNFLREPRIRPLAYHDGVVDILVETHDVWTLQLGPSFGRSGGKNDSSLEFQDHNLLGFGKTLIAGFSRGVDRDSTYFEWRDPAVFGGRWIDSLRWAKNSDGRDWRVQFVRPFYALDVHYSAGLTLADGTGEDTRYMLGSEYDRYRHAARRFDLYAGWSPGLRAGHVLRLSAGWRVERDNFSTLYSGAAPLPVTLGPLPAARDLAYPYMRADWLTDQFHTTRNQDLIERTEDLRFGLAASLQLGLASPAFGADRRAWVYAARADYGWPLTARQQLYAGAGVSGRSEQGSAVDRRTSADLAWYWRTSRRTLTHVRIGGDAGHALDLDHYYELGGDSGLRGYPLRYQMGDARAQLKIEERVFTDWSWWRLFNVGGAAFFDAGRTYGSNPIGVPQLGWLRDVGFGLRLGNDRSALGNVIHVDIATPLNGENLSRLQFLVSTEATL